jgi:hypothetical protein
LGGYVPPYVPHPVRRLLGSFTAKIWVSGEDSEEHGGGGFGWHHGCARATSCATMELPAAASGPPVHRFAGGPFFHTPKKLTPR